MIKIIESLKDPKLFYKLEEIGGHKTFHLEGNALIHAELVYKSMLKLMDKYGLPDIMAKVAVLHDIGKINHYIKHGENDFTYPNHSNGGAEDLDKFINKTDDDYYIIKWFIKNHIRPLFWFEEGKNLDLEFKSIMASSPNRAICNLDNLRYLAVADIQGSHSKFSQAELINNLLKLNFVSYR